MDVMTERSQTRPPYQAYAAIMGVYAGVWRSPVPPPGCSGAIRATTYS